MSDISTAAPAQDPAPTPPSPAAQVAHALAQLNHPTNLDLQSRLHALEQCLRVLCAAVGPLLPTE
jgi:hypothetical protein